MLRLLKPALVIAFFALTGCATAPPKPAPIDWDTVRTQRQAVQNWQLTGRAAVTAANEGWNATLDWKQTDAKSEMRLYGPFGVGALRVSIDGESLGIETSKGERFAGEDARAMLEKTLGAPLPLASLRYWLLGVPQPVIPALLQLDDANRLGTLDQGGWHVAYDRYDNFNGQWLPSRITLQQEGIKVRVIVDRWAL